MTRYQIVLLTACFTNPMVLQSELPADERESAVKPAGALAVIKELPNPFVFTDGSLVRTGEDWAKRRGEIKSLFEDFQYGHLPPKPEKMTVTKGEITVDQEADADIQRMQLRLEHQGKAIELNVRLTTPQNKKAKVPLPVIVRGGFFGFRRPPEDPAMRLRGLRPVVRRPHLRQAAQMVQHRLLQPRHVPQALQADRQVEAAGDAAAGGGGIMSTLGGLLRFAPVSSS